MVQDLTPTNGRICYAILSRLLYLSCFPTVLLKYYFRMLIYIGLARPYQYFGWYGPDHTGHTASAALAKEICSPHDLESFADSHPPIFFLDWSTWNSSLHYATVLSIIVTVMALSMRLIVVHATYLCSCCYLTSAIYGYVLQHTYSCSFIYMCIRC